MKIISELEKIGLEMTDEQKEAITKKFSEEVISNFEHEKKLGKTETDRDNWKKRAEDAEGTLEGLEGKDFDAIQKERDEWKQKAENAEIEYKKNLHNRDYSDAVKEHVESLTFTSESAKKAYIADLTAADLTMKDGKIYGLSDFHASYLKSDPSAFVTEEQQKANGNMAAFTTQMGSQPTPGTKVTPEQLMKMKNENPNLDISQYM